jgi:hypothetical protein
MGVETQPREASEMYLRFVFDHCGAVQNGGGGSN